MARQYESDYSKKAQSYYGGKYRRMKGQKFALKNSPVLYDHKFVIASSTVYDNNYQVHEK